MSGIILPVTDTIILPDSSAVLTLSKLSAVHRNYLTDKHSTVIALPVRYGCSGRNEEDYHHLGVIIRMKSVQDAMGKVVLEVETGTRVRVDSLSFMGDTIYGEFHEEPDQHDLDEKMEEQMLSYLRGIVKDISSHFQGSEQYIKALDTIHDVNTMIAWLGRHVPMSAAELIETLIASYYSYIQENREIFSFVEQFAQCPAFACQCASRSGICRLFSMIDLYKQKGQIRNYSDESIAAILFSPVKSLAMDSRISEERRLAQLREVAALIEYALIL